MALTPAATPMPAQPFFNSVSERAALARERFFEEGLRPTGLVSEAVIQSWSRCHAARRQPRHAITFDPVSRSHIHATLERHAGLLAAARPHLQQLEAALAGSARVLLTDANGVIVHASSGPWGTHEQVLKLAARVGVSLAEAQVGTNAPALVVKTGQACTVTAQEHFYERMHSLHCAAAPVHDQAGRLVAVLDITAEWRPFAFDAAALVGVYAALIENQLLQAGAGEQQVLQFQVCPSLLGTPMQALAGLDAQGRLAWCNSTARKLLGLPQGRTGPVQAGPDRAAGVPGSSPDAAELAFLTSTAQALWQRAGQTVAWRLPNGLGVWVRPLPASSEARPSMPATGTVRKTERQSPQTAAAPVTPVTPAPPPTPGPPATSQVRSQGTSQVTAAGGATLGDITREVIDRTLAACGGNISRAARQLGVSRGLLYRRLRGCQNAPDGP